MEFYRNMGDLVMNLLFWGPPFMTGDGPNMAGLSTFQSGPKGSKRDQNGQPKCFRPFRTLLGPSGPFQTIMIFLPYMDKIGFGGGASVQKNHFF